VSSRASWAEVRSLGGNDVCSRKDEFHTHPFYIYNKNRCASVLVGVVKNYIV